MARLEEGEAFGISNGPTMLDFHGNCGKLLRGLPSKHMSDLTGLIASQSRPMSIATHSPLSLSRCFLNTTFTSLIYFHYLTDNRFAALATRNGEKIHLKSGWERKLVLGVRPGGKPRTLSGLTLFSFCCFRNCSQPQKDNTYSGTYNICTRHFHI